MLKSIWEEKDFIPVEVVELIKKQISVKLGIRPHNLELEQVVDIITGELLVRLKTFIYAHDCPPFEIKYPSSWWQAFKLAVFNPDTVLKLFPVKYKVFVVSSEVLFPFIPIEVADKKPFMRFTVAPVMCCAYPPDGYHCAGISKEYHDKYCDCGAFSKK
jgi:hypothetical protein